MLSIIIPVYNTGQYISKCIDSICNQTYEDWELILVDDGSTDASGTTCDKKAKIDSRIRVIHKENGGVSSARNKGLDAASGDYIMFVDSDDWVLPDLCEKLMNQAYKADMVIGGIHEIDTFSEHDFFMKDASLQFSEIGKYFDELYTKCLINAPFSKVYRKKIIEDQRFPLGVALGEDLIFNLTYIAKCKNIALVNNTSYIYNCLNEGSAIKHFRESDIDQIIVLYRAGKAFQKRYCGEKVEKSKVIEERLCSNGIGMIQLICYSDRSNQEKKSLIRKLLYKKDFIRCCHMKFDFPLKYAIPQELCKRKDYYALRVFFFGKHFVQEVFNLKSASK